jgi:hypothetical protein
MNRSLTAVFAGLEALLVVGIGIAIPLVPLTMLWGLQYGFAIDWTAFWRAAVDIWLLGHGVDITFTLDPGTALALALGGASTPVTVTIAALGFALLTVLLGVRAGRRVGETVHRGMGLLVSLGTFAAASLGVTLTALQPAARPSISQGLILPTVVFAVGLVIGVRGTRNPADDSGSSLRDWVADWPPAVRAATVAALRGGAAATAGIIALAALVTAVALIGSYARIIELYEGLQTQLLGGVAVTVGELAVLPNVVIWTASWLIGPGFAIGTGSTVSPLATQLGPVPAVPILGAIPSGSLTLGFLGLLVPVVIGFLIGVWLAPGLRDHRHSPWLLPATALGAGAVAAVLLGILAWWSAGSAGPGRLQTVGPNPWAVGGWAALELTITVFIGLLASGRARSQR